MKAQVKALVVGGGAVGTSIAYHLARHGWDDVMLLDTFVEVFVWLGANCNDTERKMAMETAVKYVDNATDGRSSDTSILLVQQGAEPRMFTAHFHGWDANRASLADEYERQLAELRANNGGGEDEDGGHFGEYAEGMSPSQTRAQRELAEARAGKVFFFFFFFF